MRIRTFLIALLIIGLSGVGVEDLLHGQYRTGVAAILLAAANGLLLI